LLFTSLQQSNRHRQRRTVPQTGDIFNRNRILETGIFFEILKNTYSDRCGYTFINKKRFHDINRQCSLFLLPYLYRMKKIKCLLIDDDLEELEIFRFALDELSTPSVCYSARTGKEALKFLLTNKQHPDFIFLDMNMPRMDGKQCLAAIKKLETACRIPVILYSSTFIDHQKKDLLSLGATGFLTKTSSIPDLAAKLSRLFGVKEKSQSKRAVSVLT
jgi:CheY-like chemotaxis protein